MPSDTGTHFTDPGGEGWSAAAIRAMIARKQLLRARPFELAGAQNDVDHRLAKPRRPWTNAQAAHINRTRKQATLKRFDCDTHGHRRGHLAGFGAAAGITKRLKTRNGLTP